MELYICQFFSASFSFSFVMSYLTFFVYGGGENNKKIVNSEVNDGGIGGVGCYQIMWSGVLKRICYGILKISLFFLFG